MNKKLKTQSHFAVSLKTQKIKTLQASRSQGEPRTTKDHQGRTKANQGEPRTTEERTKMNRGQPRKEPRATKEGTEGNRGQPRATESNRGQPRARCGEGFDAWFQFLSVCSHMNRTFQTLSKSFRKSDKVFSMARIQQYFAGPCLVQPKAVTLASSGWPPWLSAWGLPAAGQPQIKDARVISCADVFA